MIKNRIDLAEYFNSLGFKVGAEIGVWEGYYSEVLCKKIPGLKLFCIDPWEPYHDHMKLQSIDLAYKKTIDRLAPYNVTIIKADSMSAKKYIVDGSLDFVYIDGNHEYDHVKHDIRAWAHKVKIGGIISGHDYYKTPHGNVGVIKAVDKYVKSRGYKLNVIDWDKSQPWIDDQQPSWWFVKDH